MSHPYGRRFVLRLDAEIQVTQVMIEWRCLLEDDKDGPQIP
jgi:hypothetical protein